jgi:hypothetical protein
MLKMGWPPEKITVFIDSEADDQDEYKSVSESVGFNLHVFDMDTARSRFDYVHRPSPSLRSAGQARNMFHDYAKEKGIDFFNVQDDDTSRFEVRIYGNYTRIAKPDDIQTCFAQVEKMMRKHKIGLFGLSQCGEMFAKDDHKMIRYKVMNCSFCLNEMLRAGERGVQDDDASMFVNAMNEGLFCVSLRTGIVLKQCMSATQSGGLTDLYNECKLLNKSLVCPIQFPSSIKATRQKKNGNRLHHQVNYRYLFPKIMKGERYNLAWDTYPEDTPFTCAPQHERNQNRGIKKG